MKCMGKKRDVESLSFSLSQMLLAWWPFFCYDLPYPSLASFQSPGGGGWVNNSSFLSSLDLAHKHAKNFPLMWHPTSSAKGGGVYENKNITDTPVFLLLFPFFLIHIPAVVHHFTAAISSSSFHFLHTHTERELLAPFFFALVEAWFFLSRSQEIGSGGGREGGREEMATAMKKSSSFSTVPFLDFISVVVSQPQIFKRRKKMKKTKFPHMFASGLIWPQKTLLHLWCFWGEFFWREISQNI